MSPDHSVAIIGSGFSGLGMAVELERSGRGDFMVYERADALGGTWRDNHYPGCACDVPAPLYSYSFAPNPDWSRLYAGYEEIRAYMEDCADKFGVRDRIRLNTTVQSAEWDELNRQWVLELDGGETATARFLVAGIGGLTQPQAPDIPGLADFEGPCFHTAEWDHSVDLTGKRVAVIGTGASAIQVIPKLAREVAHLDVYMRTPPWIAPKIDWTFSRFERGLFRILPLTQKFVRAVIFSITESLAYPLTKNIRALRLPEAYVRAHLRRQVKDPVLREKLTPNYRLGCKRVLPANNFYPALGRENVDLITEPIERIGVGGPITADGAEHPVDVVITATGFDIKAALTGQKLRGRGGVELGERWLKTGIEAHRGSSVHGFPNMMMLSGPNTGTGSTSQLYMIQAQIRYVLRALEHMERHGVEAIEVRESVQAAYNAELQAKMPATVWLSGGCQSWYMVGTESTPVLYPGFSSQFSRSIRRFRPDEYEVVPAAEPPSGDPPAIPGREPAPAIGGQS